MFVQSIMATSYMRMWMQSLVKSPLQKLLKAIGTAIQQRFTFAHKSSWHGNNLVSLLSVDPFIYSWGHAVCHFLLTGQYVWV